jgi:hypothetical protein
VRLTKSQRETLRKKFDGKCAYCGTELGAKWHADHIRPVIRNDWMPPALAARGSMDHPDRDTPEQMNPACAACNIDKHSMSIEEWRGVIERSNDVLMRDVSTFRRAVRFGLIERKNETVVFHFEFAAKEPS